MQVKFDFSELSNISLFSSFILIERGSFTQNIFFLDLSNQTLKNDR